LEEHLQLADAEPDAEQPDAEQPEWVLVHAETGEPIDLAALEAQAKPVADWTLEETQAWGERGLGWGTKPVDPAWAEQVAEAMTRAHPDQAQEFRRIVDFVLHRGAMLRRAAPVTWVTTRPRPRDHAPRPRRVASSPRRARAPNASGEAYRLLSKHADIRTGRAR
jgi:hypothetical protein